MSGTRILARVAGACLALIGLVMLAGGTWLVLLDGSGFYLVAGLLLTAVATGLWRQRSYAFGIAVGLLVLSMAWAWGEVGLDYWQWVPRVSLFLVVTCIAATLYPGLKNGKGIYGSRGVRRLALPALLTAIVGGTLASFYPHSGAAPLPRLQGAFALAHSDTGERGTPDWPQYGQDVRGSRYSALSEIDTSNVADLEVAWQYRTGDVPSGEAAFQGTPIKLGDMLYVCTPYSKVIAIDAETGDHKWAFDPKVKSKEWQRCRGLASWSEPDGSGGRPPGFATHVLYSPPLMPG